MKRIYGLLLLALVGLSTTTQAQTQTWSEKTPLGYDVPSRMQAGMTSLNGKLYILGGYSNTVARMYNFTEYDPATGIYTELAPLSASSGNICVTLNGKIYGVSNGSYIEEYDINSDTWTIKAGNFDASFESAGDAAAFVINDTLFVFSQRNNTFFSYNVVTDTWFRRANYPGSATRGAMAFAANGKGYMGGGTSALQDCFDGGSGCFLQDFYEYDPTADTWTPKASLPKKLKSGVAMGYNGKGYLGMGYAEEVIPSIQGNVNTSWYEYDPGTNLWASKATPSLASAKGTATIINDDIYVFGGSGSGYQAFINYNFNVKYNITADEWSTNQLRAGGNSVESAGFYANNKLYVGGGHDGQALTDFNEYDIATDSWAVKAAVPTTHTQRACVTVNGKGYFIGGYARTQISLAPNYGFTDTVIVYDPTNDTWAAKANYPGGKRRDMAAFSLNGKIYAGKGYSDGTTNANFYEYDPVTDTWSPIADCPITDTFYGMAYYTFTIADTGYVFSTTSPYQLYAYTAYNNTWTQKASGPPSYAGAGREFNQAFSYGNKGYVYNVYDCCQRLLYQYDSSTDSWEVKTGFHVDYPTIIQSPEGAYFAFGINGLGGTNGSTVSNKLWKFDLEADVSSQVGDYNICASTPYGGAYTISDTDADLFAAISSNSNVCSEVNSVNPLLPYRTLCGSFGNEYNENGMFLNKSILLTNQIANGGTLRLYYTTAELNDFVLAFNTQYNSNMTLDSIGILNYRNTGHDSDPLNNVGPFSNFTLNTPLFISYGADKYVEILSDNNNPLYGEFYAVLATAPHQTINQTACTSYTLHGETFTSSDTYIQTIPNTEGCDSVFTLNLIINTVDTSVTSVAPQLTANAVGAQYQWVDCNNNNSPINGQDGQDFVAVADGSYAVIVTQNGCSEMSGCRTLMITGILGLEHNGNQMISPNPSNGLFKINTTGKVQYLVIDALGREVMNLNATAPFTLDLSNEPSGVYTLRLQTEQGSLSNKLIKE